MFTKIRVSNSYFYKAIFSSELKDAALWAKETAFKKANYTEDTWQRRPNKFSKFVDIYYGDFAKNIVKLFLKSQSQSLSLTEYDLIRDDEFKQHDLFDLKLLSKEIEIKSSLEKYTKSTLDLFEKRRIIVNVGNAHETLSDFVVQVFFVPEDLRRYEVIENQNKKRTSLTDSELEKLCIDEMNYSLTKTTIYIAGWIDKAKEMEAIAEAKQYKHGFGLKNYSSNANYRKYANVLIKDSKHMDELVSVLENIQEEEKR